MSPPIHAFNEADGCNCVSGWRSSCVLVKRVREGDLLCHEMLCNKVWYEEQMNII